VVGSMTWRSLVETPAVIAALEPQLV